MKVIFVLLTVALLCCPMALRSQTENGSTSRVSIVERILDEKESGFASGYLLKQNVRLGDGGAKVLREMFTTDEMLSPKNLSHCLSIMGVSFARRNAIEFAIDKKPTITLVLLRKLRSKTKDPRTRDQIDLVLKDVHRKARAD